MPVTNEQYDLYKPTRLKVISLGIGISDETNDTLNLTNTQHLIVGETLLNPGNGTTEKAYGLIVDKQGIAVNATLPDRAAQSNVYAAYIEGNVFVSGNLVACNVISEGGGGGGGSGGASNFWIQSTGDRDSIYFPGRITYGNRGNNVVARNNTHACAIVESADRTINHAQISVQNTQLAEVHRGDYVEWEPGVSARATVQAAPRDRATAIARALETVAAPISPETTVLVRCQLWF